MNKSQYLNQRIHRPLRSALVLIIGATWAFAASADVTKSKQVAAKASAGEVITVLVDDCRREVLVPVDGHNVRIAFPEYSGTKCHRSCIHDCDHGREFDPGPWRAVGADSCSVPFASQLERVDCRAWQLRRRYSQATSRYEARTRQPLGAQPWED